MTLKFLHAADIHLDSPLKGLASYPDAPVERLRTATRDAFANLIDRALAEAVDFLVIAGDLYDGDWKDFNTGLFFVRQMGRLRAAGIPVYLLYGNHDAESEVKKGLELPDNVHVFSARKAETFLLEGLRVALHGRSFREAATVDNLLPSYPAPVPGWFNIGVLHTALEGNAEHARYAPCSIAELEARGYQYWALGHVHAQSIRLGPPVIAYPGNLQGRQVRETGARGALLVTAEDKEHIVVEPLALDVLRWHVVEVDVSAATTLAEAVRAAGRTLNDLLDRSDHDLPLAVRVVLTGDSAAHGLLLASEGRLRQEVIGQSLSLAAERIWIEKVRVATRAPRSSAAASSDAVRELEDLAGGATADAEFLTRLQADCQAILEKLPHDVLAAAPELDALRQDPAAALPARIAAALPLLTATVLQGAVRGE